MSPHDEREIMWFLVEEGRDRRSTCGPMLDNLSLFAVKPEPDPERQEAARMRKPWEPDPNEITAQPTAETRNAGRSDPDDRDHIRKGKVSKRMKVVELQDPKSALVLRVYYGDAGAVCASAPKIRYGRIASLFPLTEGGRKLAKDSRRDTSQAALKLTDAERIANQIAAQDVSPTVKRERPIAMALREAEELLAAACDRWNLTAPPKKAG